MPFRSWVVLAVLGLLPIPAGAVNPANWSTGVLETTGGDVFWMSPTTVTTGLADYDWTYEVVSVEARTLGFWIDITSQLAGEGVPLTGGGTEPGLPFVLVDQSLSTSGNSADFLIQVDGTGRGLASITNVVFGSYLGFDITGIRASLNFSVEGFPYGDYNHDHNVDVVDYSLWHNSFGSTFDLTADGNRSGNVDAADYALWRDHAGLSAGSGAGNTAVIPEPASIAIVTFFSLALVSIRRIAK